MTEHLIAMGHRRIGFIRGHESDREPRYEGFQAAMTQAGLAIDPGLIQQGYFTYRSGLEAAEKLLSRKSPPTAIFASNDDMAAAAVSVAHRRGLDVPRDLSVVGFDDTPTATTVWPNSTVRQPIAAMAGSAIELLLRSIRQRKDGEARGLRPRGGACADQARFRGSAVKADFRSGGAGRPGDLYSDSAITTLLNISPAG